MPEIIATAEDVKKWRELIEKVRNDEALGGRIREKAEGNMSIVKREEGRNYRSRNEKQ